MIQNDKKSGGPSRNRAIAIAVCLFSLFAVVVSFDYYQRANSSLDPVINTATARYEDVMTQQAAVEQTVTAILQVTATAHEAGIQTAVSGTVESAIATQTAQP